MPDGHLDAEKEYFRKDRNYLYSRALDIYKWSDYLEVNSFVNDIYNGFFLSPIRVKKKHLKVVLLDLYVAWFQDPKLHISVHLSEQSYSNGQVSIKGKHRYNETHIRRTTIDIIHRLVDVDLIEFKKGFGRPDQPSYDTRIWASSKLIKMFEDAKFGVFNIHYFGEDKQREYLILCDENKNDIEYTDTPRIKQMRKILLDYNALLEKTFIDIPSLNEPYINRPPKQLWTRTADNEWKENIPTRISIMHDGKFTTRIFNNSSWEDGGRFYGGFWQRVGSKYRSQIYMNHNSTVEVDYSALLVVLAYATKNIDYWSKTEEDPYSIPINGINDPKVCRNIAKLFFLMALNASTETKAFKAFRNEWDYSEFRNNFTDEKLSEILNTIKERHPAISDLICTGAGVQLQYIDSQILECIIKDFIATNTPILCVHDSLIVQFGQEDRLEKLIKQAFYEVTNYENIKIKFNNNLTNKAWGYSKFLKWEYYLYLLKVINNPVSSDGYNRRMNRHYIHFKLDTLP